MQTLNYVDIVLVAIIGISTIVAFFRGLITEVLSLIVWIGAFWGASQFAPQLSLYLEPHVEEPIRSLLSFCGTFLGCLFLGGMINLCITFILRRLKISAPDRFLGLIFGFVRGVFIASLIVIIVKVTPLQHHPLWVEAKTPASVEGIVSLMKTWIPKEFLQKMDAQQLLEEAKEQIYQSPIQPAVKPNSTE